MALRPDEALVLPVCFALCWVLAPEGPRWSREHPSSLLEAFVLLVWSANHLSLFLKNIYLKNKYFYFLIK